MAAMFPAAGNVKLGAEVGVVASLAGDRMMVVTR
jgi:hypothetical protein